MPYNGVYCSVVTMCTDRDNTGGEVVVSCTHVWWDSALWSYLVGHEGKMGKVSIRSAGQARTAGGVNIPHSYNH